MTAKSQIQLIWSFFMGGGLNRLFSEWWSLVVSTVATHRVSLQNSSGEIRGSSRR
jgi:hypothetical protein